MALSPIADGRLRALPCYPRATVAIDDLPIGEGEVSGKARHAATTFCMLHAKYFFLLILL
jgi:hypothetical protein